MKKTLSIDVTLEVEIDYVPPTKGNYTGHPDDRTPGDPGEIDIKSINCEGTTIPLHGLFYDLILEKVEQEVESVEDEE